MRREIERSRVQWLGEGDRNTNFFHSRASKRRRKNTISSFWNEEGKWCDDKANIATTVISYFKDIYSTTLPSQIEEVTNLIPVKVTSEMNDSHTQVFTAEEICMALFQMHPTKAPGLDGMSGIFYQKYWNIVGPNVTNMVLNVLNSNMFMVNINKTNITLVPKTKHPLRRKIFILLA